MPGFSAICLPAAQASWFALPVTKLLKLKLLFKPVVFIILSGFFTLSLILLNAEEKSFEFLTFFKTLYFKFVKSYSLIKFTIFSFNLSLTHFITN